MTALFEQYRPRSWSEVAGQSKALARIEFLRKRGLAGRAYWITGLTGTGKSTIARLIAEEIAEEWAIEEIDAKGLTPKAIQDWERHAASPLLGSKPGVAYIVNEAHALSDGAVKQLLTTLERIPRHAVWVFTTTLDGQLDLFDGQIDAHPLLSRCQELRLATKGLELDFAIRARNVARAEGLDGQAIDAYMRLARQCKCNLRQMLQEVEGGCMAVAQ
jgi:DNA polymerase-3 subunit gamma/tau